MKLRLILSLLGSLLLTGRRLLMLSFHRMR